MKNKCLIKRKFGHLGDLLMMTPALREFSKDNVIDIQIPRQYSEVFENLEFINAVYAIEEEKDETLYDRVIDISNFEFNYEQIRQPYIEKSKQEIFSNALNVKIAGKEPLISLTDKEKQLFENKKDVILIAPKSMNPSRDWDLKNWKVLINLILKLKQFEVIIVDRQLCWSDKRLSFFNNRTIRELFSLVSRASLVITADSGLLHIAAAFNVKTIVLFGPTDHRVRTYPNCFAISSEVGCSPCWYNRCSKKYCLELIKPLDVFRKFQEVVEVVR